MWHFRALLPNLCMKDAIGDETIAVVPCKHDRLKEIVAADARLRHLLESFSDQFGRQRLPSAIISSQQAAPLPGDDLMDFRNAVAVSCIIGGAQHSILVRPPMSSVFPIFNSDYFDIYPIFLPSEGKPALLTSSYAGIGWDTDIEKFRGQTSPRLHNVEAAIPIPDAFVLDRLMAAWRGMYVECLPVDNRVIGLFRSLQVVFHAATLLAKNEASIHDFGVCVSHWVSAMEILLHPANGDSINERRVLDVLGAYPWQTPAIRQIQDTLPASGRSKTAVPLNTVQALYHQLYKTRNDFVHGNAIGDAPYHSPFGDLQGPGWLVVAPLIFKTALSCFLGQHDASSVLEESIVAILPTSSKDSLP